MARRKTPGAAGPGDLEQAVKPAWFMPKQLERRPISELVPYARNARTHSDAQIAQLQGLVEAGIDLILTSHYTPEDLKDARTKIAYLEELKRLAAASTTAEGFKAAVDARFPSYGGANYLDMTAGFFFA